MLESVATANARLIQFARQLESGANGRTVDELLAEVCAARLQLARVHYADAEYLARRRSGHRGAVSRYYYSMHSSARAVVFVVLQTDQHNEHSSLPKNLPDDFPNRSFWVNELNKYRGLRNDADYDPFAGDVVQWRFNCNAAGVAASDFLSICDFYLRSKGIIQ